MNIGAENYAAIPRLWIMKRILLMAVAAVMLAAPFTVAQAAPFEGFPKEKPADKNVVEVVFTVEEEVPAAPVAANPASPNVGVLTGTQA